MAPNKLKEVFQKLQTDGLNARLQERDETLLVWAASEGYPEIARALIAAGADLNRVNSMGNTALIRCSCEGRIDIAEALIAAGADLNVRNEEGYTALILAKRRGYEDIVSLLVRSGADRTLKTTGGLSVDTIATNGKKRLQGERDRELETAIIHRISGLSIR
tara:strand:+ start:92 stop:577 length:486 start_codon:yes stop_codon:yes gene_type:complete